MGALLFFAYDCLVQFNVSYVSLVCIICCFVCFYVTIMSLIGVYGLCTIVSSFLLF